uniref:Uncharacterized protein n=1 Tax=Anopheles quadriannulatus TaxID=34691 RepID=A0A182XQZ7_ANOQN
ILLYLLFAFFFIFNKTKSNNYSLVFCIYFSLLFPTQLPLLRVFLSVVFDYVYPTCFHLVDSLSTCDFLLLQLLYSCVLLLCVRIFIFSVPFSLNVFVLFIIFFYFMIFFTLPISPKRGFRIP